MLRALVQDAINHHLPERQFNALMAAENSEKLLLRTMVRNSEIDGVRNYEHALSNKGS
ncbi:MAG: hypothetical protein GY743_03600 [Planctomycetaceae bacterium]|nr:hypothetical protein [Planctomycetaceae bacterium]